MPKHHRPRRAASGNTYRFFVPPTAISGDDVVIEEHALTHQLAHVLRLGPGTPVTLLDNSGWEYKVTLREITRHAVTGSVQERSLAPGEPALNLVLYVALLKSERFEWVLQKGTELGVSAFVPVVSERSVIEDAAGIGAAKLERWERIVREAAEQSRRARLPKLLPAQPFAAACENAGRCGEALMPWEGSGVPGLRATLQRIATPPPDRDPLAILSGPEGGWSEAEIDTATMYNISLVSLGPRTLRAETAPIAAAAAVFFQFGEME